MGGGEKESEKVEDMEMPGRGTKKETESGESGFNGRQRAIGSGPAAKRAELSQSFPE